MENSESFGAYLKSCREKKGIRLEEIASITKIHIRSLEHLEAWNLKQLPPDPFLRGFIIAYAKYVGLDPKEAIGRFLDDYSPTAIAGLPGDGSLRLGAKPTLGQNRNYEPTKKPADTERKTMAPPQELVENTRTIPFKKILAGATAAALVAVFVFITRLGQESASPVMAPTTEVTETNVSTPESPSPVPSEIKTEPPNLVESQNQTVPVTPIVPTAVTGNALNPSSPSPPDGFAHELVIEGKERTWIKVVFDGEPALDYFLPQGDSVTYRAKEKIKIVLGNSTGTKVIHNGVVAPGVKLQGTIRQYLFPLDARFPQDSPSRRSVSSKLVAPTEKPAATTPTREPKASKVKAASEPKATQAVEIGEDEDEATTTD